MPKDIEIEIQVQVEKVKGLLVFLKKNGKFVSEEHQVDRYFSPAHRDFTSVRPVNEWLRLRDSSGKYLINYKNWHRGEDGRSHYCDEYELTLTDLGSMVKIFGVLDMKLLVIVDKRRKIWRYRDFEVSIDCVQGLGDFVEIEYKGRVKKDPTKVTASMIAFLKEHGCGKIARNYLGYPYQLLFPEELKLEEY